MVIDNTILDELSAKAKASPRLRMNLNFHDSLEDKCHRMLNALRDRGTGCCHVPEKGLIEGMMRA